MKQIVIPRYGDVSVLELQDAPEPEPGPGEVRIRVEGAGVNFADVMARAGLYLDAPPPPMVVGYEIAGRIDAVGEGVDPGRVGQAVLGMTRFGGYAEAVVVPEVQAVIRPEGMDAITGAAIPVVGLTAWMMLEVYGRVRPGDRVLVHSAGGGVGLAALDLIKWRGATAIGTASRWKHDALRELGYDQLVDYTQVDFYEALKDEPPLDLILDPIGGDSWTRGLKLLAPGGKLICYGFSKNSEGQRRNVFRVARNLWSVPWRAMNPIALMNENRGVCGVNMGHMWHAQERASGWMRGLVGAWSEGVLRPKVHAVVPFSRAAEAHRMLHDRENFGKVVLVPDALA